MSLSSSSSSGILRQAAPVALGAVSVIAAAILFRHSKQKSDAKSSDDILFYNADLCPFAQRVWITLGEKELTYKRREVDLFHKSKDFLEVSKPGTVPAIVHSGQGYYESLLVCDYLEETFPPKSVYPASPRGKFEVRLWIQTVTKKLETQFYELLFSQDEKQYPTMKQSLNDTFRDINKQIESSGGPYLFGAKFTLADIATYPFVERVIAVLGYYRSYKLPTGDAFSPLHKWIDTVEARASVKVSRKPRQEGDASMKSHFLFAAKTRLEYLIEVYESYSKGKDESTRRRKEAEAATPYFDKWDDEYP